MAASEIQRTASAAANVGNSPATILTTCALIKVISLSATLACGQYQERSFHWVQPEQQLMTALLERAAAEMNLLALPAMVIDAQVAAQAILLLAEHTLR